MMMLQLAAKLPPGALLGSEDRALTQALGRSGGARFIAREGDLLQKDGRIIAWREARGAVEAPASAPNLGHSRFDPGPPGALLCREGANCGFVVPAFTAAVEAFTVAVLYSSAGEARTLASIFTGQTHNGLFLMESEGRLLAKDRASTISVSLPLSPTDRPRMAVLSWDSRVLRLRLGADLAEAQGSIPDFAHPGDFFIACRSNRPGLAKTLGTAALHEVLFWPETALLGSRLPEDQSALAALDRYCRWTY
jgi:hypothetical protein